MPHDVGDLATILRLDPAFDAVDDRCIGAVRALAIDMVERAGSGHPGAPLGLAPAAYVLWSRHLRHDPTDPTWYDRDRFVLSAGHASALLYALLHLFGYDLPMEELQRFRQWGSRAPGHPEYRHTPGVEATTGPLGQGFANAVGMAIAERIQAERTNRPGWELVNHRTFGICSDGDLMEGITAEAASLAGHLGLGRLTFIFDDNRITIDGPTDLSSSEDVARRFDAYGWHTVTVDDGNDLAAIDHALREAIDDIRPSLILLRTQIGFGSPAKQGTSGAHGAPLGADEVVRTKEALGWTEAPFTVPTDVRAHLAGIATRGAAAHRAWHDELAGFAREHPDTARTFLRAISGEAPEVDHVTLDGWRSPIATRKASAACLQAFAAAVPALAGGSADLAESTGTSLPGVGAFTRACAGRTLHFGVREHAMGGIMNGMALHGDMRPFGSTFLVFSDHLRPSIRLAAMMGLPVIYLFTHDSIGLGEDGPTHQPIEHLASLRAMPGVVVLRPADATETLAAWYVALARADGPTVLCLSRQDLPVLESDVQERRAQVARGAYVLAGNEHPDLILIATGSEVQLALRAREELERDGYEARVVSMPSWELFADQPRAYRDEVLPPGVRARLAIEAGATFGWSRWTGDGGGVIGLDRFGASAPGDEVFRRLGFTVESIGVAARAIMARRR